MQLGIEREDQLVSTARDQGIERTGAGRNTQN